MAAAGGADQAAAVVAVVGGRWAGGLEVSLGVGADDGVDHAGINGLVRRRRRQGGDENQRSEVSEHCVVRPAVLSDLE